MSVIQAVVNTVRNWLTRNKIKREILVNVEKLETRVAVMENGCVVFSGLNAGSTVSVYQQDGRLIKGCKADANGKAIVELSGLPKGVLIIHSNKTDIKIINR